MPFPPADDCADTLVVHGQSLQEMTEAMWQLGFDVGEFEMVRHAVVTQLPGRVVIVLLNENYEVIHAETGPSPATEEDIREWHRHRANQAPRN